MIYKIGNYQATSKKKIQEKAKEILYQGSLNSKLEGINFEFMISYFQTFHIDWYLKKGKGVESILRIKEPKYGKYRAYKIERKDGTSTDISYIINNIQKKNYYREFKQAMRELVEPQIIEFRNNTFKNINNLTCPINKEIIFKYNSHVHHDNPSFDELIKSFIKKFDIRLSPDLFPKDLDNQIRYDINDDIIKNRFFYFIKKTQT